MFCLLSMWLFIVSRRRALFDKRLQATRALKNQEEILHQGRSLSIRSGETGRNGSMGSELLGVCQEDGFRAIEFMQSKIDSSVCPISIVLAVFPHVNMAEQKLVEEQFFKRKD